VIEVFFIREAKIESLGGALSRLAIVKDLLRNAAIRANHASLPYMPT